MVVCDDGCGPALRVTMDVPDNQAEHTRRTREAYDRLASVWSAATDEGPFNGLLERPALRALVPGGLHGTAVLEAGCGSGAQARRLGCHLPRSPLRAGHRVPAWRVLRHRVGLRYLAQGRRGGDTTLSGAGPWGRSSAHSPTPGSRWTGSPNHRPPRRHYDCSQTTSAPSPQCRCSSFTGCGSTPENHQGSGTPSACGRQPGQHRPRSRQPRLGAGAGLGLGQSLPGLR
jgi:hypothetical protein